MPRFVDFTAFGRDTTNPHKFYSFSVPNIFTNTIFGLPSFDSAFYKNIDQTHALLDRKPNTFQMNSSIFFPYRLTDKRAAECSHNPYHQTTNYDAFAVVAVPKVTEEWSRYNESDNEPCKHTCQ